MHDRPGVTRDRLSAEVEWQGRPFMLVDTGGIGLLKGEQGGDDFAQEIVTQVQVALDDVDVILFVVSVHEGIVPMDLEVAGMLREAGKPVLLIIRWIPSGTTRGLTSFPSLRFEHMFPVSAPHDRGVDTPLGPAVGLLPKPLAKPVESGDEEDQAEAEPPMNIAIVGRPNVGKSSIINALTESQRVIVSEISGTTRDAIDVPFEVEIDGVRQQYNLIDTAGIRKRRRIKDSVEFFSVNRSDKAIERCDLRNGARCRRGCHRAGQEDLRQDHRSWLCLCRGGEQVGSLSGRRRESPKVAAKSEGAGRKKVQPQKQEEMMFEEFGKWVQSNMFFLDYAPVIFTSALEGFQLDRLLEAIRYVSGQLNQSLPTSLLNRALQEAIERNPAPSSKGHRFKLYYATQVGTRPPTFLLFVNRKELLSDNYTRYLIGILRKAFGFEGCNIRLVAKPRPKSIDPIRRTSVKKKTGKKASLREQSRLKESRRRKKRPGVTTPDRPSAKLSGKSRRPKPRDAVAQRPASRDNSARTCPITLSQSPGVGWRNSRLFGYHGESSRCSIQRQSGECDSITHVRWPSAPAKCAIAVSMVTTRSMALINRAVDAKSVICVAIRVTFGAVEMVSIASVGSSFCRLNQSMTPSVC